MIKKGELVNQIRDCAECGMTFASHHEQLNVCSECLNDKSKTIKVVEQWKRNESKD
jgi:predicted Zn-ribbon and HTH transcriptional regulator